MSKLGGLKSFRMKYLPLGKTFEEDRTDHQRTSCLFNGKDPDKEKGLYRYGNRFYDPGISMSYEVDPVKEDMPGLLSFCDTSGYPLNASNRDVEKIIFVNGFLGFGSPKGGAEYWGGADGNFVKTAQEYFKGRTTPFFTNFDYHNMFSTTAMLKDDGYIYAEKYYEDIVKGTDHNADVFCFVSHSMGGAFSEGMAKYLKEKGLTVEVFVYIDAWRPSELNKSGDENNKTKVIDATITNDPVQRLSTDLKGNRDIPDADIRYRHKSKEKLTHRHRDLIDSGNKLWMDLLLKDWKSSLKKENRIT